MGIWRVRFAGVSVELADFGRNIFKLKSILYVGLWWLNSSSASTQFIIFNKTCLLVQTRWYAMLSWDYKLERIRWLTPTTCKQFKSNLELSHRIGRFYFDPQQWVIASLSHPRYVDLRFSQFKIVAYKPSFGPASSSTSLKSNGKRNSAGHSKVQGVQ